VKVGALLGTKIILGPISQQNLVLTLCHGLTLARN